MATVSNGVTGSAFHLVMDYKQQWDRTDGLFSTTQNSGSFCHFHFELNVSPDCSLVENRGPHAGTHTVYTLQQPLTS